MTSAAGERPTFLVTGASGQIGHELVRELAPLGRVHAPPRTALDLADPDSIRQAVRAARPTMILNAAAYTAVDQAEGDEDACVRVNAVAPGVLAEEAKRLGAGLVHFSTDYVFDGAKRTPYAEDDDPRPLQVYGRSKLAGERAVAQVGGAFAIVRTSWVYGLRGRNFLLTMLRLAREQAELRVVDDQVGCPTWSRMVAAGTAAIVARVLPRAGGRGGSLADVAGVYHLAATGRTSWAAFAAAILDAAPEPRPHRPVVRRIRTVEYPTAATRPAWSVLETTKAEERFGVTLPPWEEQLARALER